AAANAAMRGLVEDQLGEALVATVGDRAARRRPREHRLAVLDPLRLAFVLGETGPRDLGIGIRHRRDLPRVEERLLSGRRFRTDVTFLPPAGSSGAWASCAALCASIGLPMTSPIAWMCTTFVRICLSTGMKPRS